MRGAAIASALVAMLHGAARAERLLDSERRDAWEQRGVAWSAAYAGEVFAAPQLDERLVAGGLLVVAGDVDLGTLASESFGALHIAALGIHGSGLTAELADIHGVSGNDAPDDVRVFEAWYEQHIAALTLRAGLLAADQEFVLAERSATLLGATFGITSQFSVNLLGPVYPVATPGVSGRLELPAVTVRAAMYDGTQSNRHGIPTELGPARLAVAEVVLRGVLKLGAWHHTERGHAVFAVLDAQVSDELGGFARAGHSPGQPIETYLDGGIRLAAGSPRPDDFFCVGLAYADATDGAQIMVEAGYQAQIRWLTLQPDLQLVMLRERTVGVIATRVTVAF